MKHHRYLDFRCTGCGNCCKDPLLPLTDTDLGLIAKRTGDHPLDFVRWVSRNEIRLDDEPEAFVRLRQGKRVMTLAHERGACRYLGADDRCTIYDRRPLGCRIFPFDPSFNRQGQALQAEADPRDRLPLRARRKERRGPHARLARALRARFRALPRAGRRMEPRADRAPPLGAGCADCARVSRFLGL
jgi:Fe-S-cluster containining protein